MRWRRCLSGYECDLNGRMWTADPNLSVPRYPWTHRFLWLLATQLMDLIMKN